MDAQMACALRLDKVRQKLDSLGLAGIYLRTTTNIAWITAFSGVFDEEKAHALLVTKDKAVLHTDSRYSVALKKLAADVEIEISDTVSSHFDFYLENELKQLKSHSRIAFEDTLTLREFHSQESSLSDKHSHIELVETNNFIETLRATKDEYEVALMREAQKITDAAFSHICSFIKEGMTESQVQRELDYFMLNAGSDGLAFPSIVAAGAHGASPHAQPGENKLKRGDAVVMDFGARFKGYCSDMTRTIFIGEPSDELRQAYATLRKANEECEAKIAAGVRASLVHNHAEKVLARGGYANKMGHSLGHSVGLDIHEAPNLSWKNDDELAEGVVVTVEPGIYIEGEFGMRLEDFGLVTKEGYEVFTQSSHEMVIIDVRD